MPSPSPTRSEADRRALGRLHPSFMGGEHLPDRRETEVEIARINIDSTTSDVTSVYAKAGKDRILDRVVDEHDGDTLTTRRTRIAMPPLSLGERNTIFLGAWPLNEVPEGNELDRDGAQDFTRPSSGSLSAVRGGDTGGDRWVICGGRAEQRVTKSALLRRLQDGTARFSPPPHTHKFIA